jgi:hypothetical protein
MVGFHPELADVVNFDNQEQAVRSWATGLKEGHGITLVETVVRDVCRRPWWKMRRAPGGAYGDETRPARTWS